MQFLTRKEQIIKNVKALDKKGLFSFVALTNRKALKKNRETKESTPELYAQGVDVLYSSTVSLGNEYEKAVNNRLKKEGKDQDFEAQGSYAIPDADNLILYKHKEKDQYYLRVYPNLCHSFHTTIKYYLALNGQEITKEDYKKIEALYLEKRDNKNKNQGLDNDILVRNYKIENVLYVKQGEFVLTNLDDLLKKALE